MKIFVSAGILTALSRLNFAEDQRAEEFVCAESKTPIISKFRIPSDD